MPALRIGIFLLLVLGLVACRHRVPQTVSRMPSVPAAQASAAAPQPSVQTQLEALRRMHADGLITQQEYDTKRKKVLEGL